MTTDQDQALAGSGEATPPKAAAAQKQKRLKRLGDSRWGRLLSLFILGLFGLVSLHLFDLVAIPFPPFTTTGQIYVDSPEVYTRERLVNDRYDQDYWLRERLKQLDTPEKLRLMVGEQSQILRGQVGEAESGPDADNIGAGAGGPRRLTFEQEFRVASGIRDMIRQQILENMLDDRHDLTGNSVYGLKFDTTVIPGANTRRRAFVHVTLTIDDLFAVGAPDAQGNLDQSDARGNEGAVHSIKLYEEQKEHYSNWVKDVKRRLNRVEDSVYESMKEQCRTGGWSDQYFYDKLSGKTVEVVLGIPEKRFRILSRLQSEPMADGDAIGDSDESAERTGGSGSQSDGLLMLPDPWSYFFQIDRKLVRVRDAADSAPCGSRVWFDVLDLHEIFVAQEQMAVEGEDEVTEPEDLVRVGETVDGKWAIYASDWEYKNRESAFELVSPKYDLDDALVERLREENEQRCKLPNPGESCRYLESNSGRERPFHVIDVPSGFLNFRDHMQSRDIYPYAIFPKNDVVGIFADTLAQLSAAAPSAGLFDLTRARRESTTASVLVGYGLGGGEFLGTKRDANTSINFGWVISSSGDMEPTQKSELALVSVPAWADTLKLNVSVGWLDRNGKPRPDEQRDFDLEIAVPPNLEAFDSIYREDAQVTLGPTIRDNEMDPWIYVRAGKETKILIPGSRLWRSASVTLGAQTAKRITVLPNMEGIIAEFDAVAPPYAAYEAGTDPESSLGSIDNGEAEGGRRGRVPDDDRSECDLYQELLAARDLKVRPVRLRVWTSEGMAQALQRVCVVYHPDEVLVSTANKATD